MRLFIFAWLGLITPSLNPVDGLYVDTDLDLLAAIITAECSICSENEQYLVGSTVLNRVDDKKYPNTIKGVLTQPGQYLGITSRWFVTTPKACEIAQNLIEGENREYGVIYFYARDSPDTSFVKKMEPYVKYDTMTYHLYASHADF